MIVCCVTFLGLFEAFAPPATNAQSPATPQPPALHQAIDQLVGSSPETAPNASDGEFIRRIYVDLLGAVPTREEYLAFLRDPSPGKRSEWIDRLIKHPEHSLHVAQSFDRILMERRPHPHVSRDLWLNALIDHFVAQKPLHELLAGMLNATGTKTADRGLAHFLLDRTGDPHLITRDVGRLFLGRDMQCAQCHDHPLIEDYVQVDYHGLLAFVSSGYMQEIKGKNKEDKDVTISVYLEKPAADAAFESVFRKGTKLRTGPRVLTDLELSENYLLPHERTGSAYEQDVVAKPNAALPSKPANSRREALAKQLTNPQNRIVAKNWANRIWALMMGRGLVEPVDMHHADNPAENEPLLDLLTDQFIAMNWNVSQYMGEIAKSQVYQRSFVSPTHESVESLVNKLGLSFQVVQQSFDQSKTDFEKAEAEAGKSKDVYSAASDAWLVLEKERVESLASRDAAEQQLIQKTTALNKAIAEQQTETKALETLKLRMEAAQRSAAAAEELIKLGTDAEAEQVAKTMRGKEKSFADQVPTLEKKIAEKTQAVAAATMERDSSTQAVQAAHEKVTQLGEAYLAADKTRQTSPSRISNCEAQCGASLENFSTLARAQ